MNEEKKSFQNQLAKENSLTKKWQSSKYHKSLGKNYTNDLYGVALRKGTVFF